MPWFIQIIGFLFLGTAIIVGVVAGLPYFITKALQHDQDTCECWDCQNRRTRSIQRREENERLAKLKAEKAKLKRDQQGRRSNLPFPNYVPEPTPERDTSNYWSTEELRTGYHVFVKGVVYEVGAIRTLSLETGDVKVLLTNILTRGWTFIVITGNMKKAKIWHKGFGEDLWK